MKLKQLNDGFARRFSALMLGATLLVSGWRRLVPTMPSMRKVDGGDFYGSARHRSFQKQVARMSRNLFYSQHHLSQAERDKLAVRLVLGLRGHRVAAGRRLG